MEIVRNVPRRLGDHVSSGISRRTMLAIACPDCGDYSERPLTWLHTASDMDCDKCGVNIDLKAGESRALIERVISRVERTTTKLQ